MRARRILSASAPLLLSLSLSLSLGLGCNGDDAAQGDSEATGASTGDSGATSATASAGSASASATGSASASGTGTTGTGTSTTTGDATSESDSDSATTGNSATTGDSATDGTSTTGDTTGDTTDTDTDTGTTTGGIECVDLPDATAKPLTADISESRPTLFARDDGYHLFYMTSDGGFETHLVKLDLEGAVVGDASLVEPAIWRHRATNGQRYAAATTVQVDKGAKGELVIADINADDTLSILGAAPIPREGRSHGAIAVAWNPVAAEWGLVFEEKFDIDPNEPGIVHARLYFGRVSADGDWVDGSKKLLTTTATDVSTQISDWANPLIWVDDHYAIVWAEYGPNAIDVYLSELAADGAPTRTKLDQGRFSRGVVAWDGASYGVAWGHWDFDDHYNLRFATVKDGVVSDHLHLGDDAVYSSDASIVHDGERYTVAWHETANGASKIHYARVDADTLAADTVQITEENYDDHDWVHSLVHNGCRHALAQLRGINPSDGWVVFFE